MGKLAVVCIVLLAVAVPALISAAPGNPAGELGREEIKFQGMFAQLCALNGGDSEGGTYAAAMEAVNARRRAAYQRRGKPVPSDLECEGGGEPE